MLRGAGGGRAVLAAVVLVGLLSGGLGVAPPADAVRVETAYARSEAQDLYNAAAYLGATPDWVQRFGVQSAWFVINLAGVPRQDMSWIVARTGDYRVRSNFQGESLDALLGLQRHYNLDAAQAARLGATFLVFLTGVDSAQKGRPWPQVKLPAPDTTIKPVASPPSTKPPSSGPTTTTTAPTTTTKPPSPPPPSGQCTTWPKDATCWPQRGVPGTPDHQFWNSHPCTLAYRETNAASTGPIPLECALAPLGTVVDPTRVQWPIPKVTTWWQYWQRWRQPLTETVPRLVETSVTATDLGAGSYRVRKDCYQLEQARLIVRSARWDAIRSGGWDWLGDPDAWPVRRNLALLEQLCADMVTGVVVSPSPFDPPHYGYWMTVIDEGWLHYLWLTRIYLCAEPWNRGELAIHCERSGPPLPW